MHYELSSQPHVLARWREARLAAQEAAARTGQAVAIWRVTIEGRMRVGELFPDGRWARLETLHRLPEDVGL